MVELGGGAIVGICHDGIRLLFLARPVAEPAPGLRPLFLASVRCSRPEMMDGGTADAGDDGRGIDAVPEYGWGMDMGFFASFMASLYREALLP